MLSWNFCDLKRGENGPARSLGGEFRQIELGRFPQVGERLVEGLPLGGGAGLGIVRDQPIAVAVRIDDGCEIHAFLGQTVSDTRPGVNQPTARDRNQRHTTAPMPAFSGVGRTAVDPIVTLARAA